ncbi:MAG TPA: ATP synthase subunit C [Spirochaetota bacterium]|nr:ATP synthase subunit C [Spirochaetota bacterium]HPJ34245.1 ATP synthase subunit C [Spirochaetota bacterium]
MNKKGLFLKAVFYMIAGAGTALFFAAAASGAETGAEGAVEMVKTENGRALFAYAAVAAVGLSCITSAYALARIGTAAMGAMSEKPEIGGRALVFLGMAEGIAIYGLIVAIMLLNKI